MYSRKRKREAICRRFKFLQPNEKVLTTFCTCNVGAFSKLARGCSFSNPPVGSIALIILSFGLLYHLSSVVGIRSQSSKNKESLRSSAIIAGTRLFLCKAQVLPCENGKKDTKEGLDQTTKTVSSASYTIEWGQRTEAQSNHQKDKLLNKTLLAIVYITRVAYRIREDDNGGYTTGLLSTLAPK